MRYAVRRIGFLASFFCLATSLLAGEPLHTRIDALIATAAKGKAASPLADDAEFLRRVTLDLAGTIPTGSETRAFLADGSADKRTRRIERLLRAPTYAARMSALFNAILMERLGESEAWNKYLLASFAANKPWDVMSREILRADPDDPAAQGASFFYSKRLENYGQNPVDYPALTRDVGRLFLGKDFRCAQCHDHLFINDYKQEDFQGLFAFFKNTSLMTRNKKNASGAAGPVVAEKPTTEKVAFMSVFKKVPRQVGPRIPGMPEIPIPSQEKGKEYAKPADSRAGDPGKLQFSPLAKLAEQLPSPDNAAFVQNIVNRLWWAFMGRGLVHPLDLNHKANPPSHPEVLDLVAKEFVAHKFDIRWLVGELALTQTYQRSSILPAGAEAGAETFLTAAEKRLSAEQLLTAMTVATGAKTDKLDSARTRFLRAFANPAREPEDEITPSLKAALFVLNDSELLGWLAPRPGNLVDRLSRLPDDGIAEELYLCVLSRLPSAEEKREVADYLKNSKKQRPAALGQLAWALLASTEFCVNH